MNTVSELFNQSYLKIGAKIAFSTEWKNDTGYLDKLVDANVGLRSGECAVTVDDFKRRVLVIGTPVGNVVLFERYSPSLVLNTKNGIAEAYKDVLTSDQLKDAIKAIETTGVYVFDNGRDRLTREDFEEKRSSIIVGNYPSAIENMFGGMGGIGNALTVEGFDRLFKSPTWNIGRDLDDVARQFARAAQPKVKLLQPEVQPMLQPADVTMENIHEIVKFANPSIAAIAEQHPLLKGLLHMQAGMMAYANGLVEHAQSIEKRYGEEMKALADAGDYQTFTARIIEITCDDLNNTLEYAKEFTGIVTPLGKATSHIVLRGIKRNAGKLGALVGTCVKFGLEVKAEVNAVKAEIAMLKEGFMPSDTEGAVKH